MNNIINIFIIFILILAPLNASGTDLKDEEEFVNKFSNEAIIILSNNEISENEKKIGGKERSSDFSTTGWAEEYLKNSKKKEKN